MLNRHFHIPAEGEPAATSPWSHGQCLNKKALRCQRLALLEIHPSLRKSASNSQSNDSAATPAPYVPNVTPTFHISPSSRPWGLGWDPSTSEPELLFFHVGRCEGLSFVAAPQADTLPGQPLPCWVYHVIT